MKALRDYLRQHNDLFFDALELATSGFYLRPVALRPSEDNRITLFSKHCFASLGYQIDDENATDWTWLELFHPEDLNVVADAIQKHATSHAMQPLRLQYRLRRHNGTYRYTEETGRLIHPTGDDGAYWLGVIHDIDERHRSEMRLETSHQEMQTILDTIPAFVWFKDENHRILRVNRAAADASGMRVEDIEGRLTRDVYPEQASRYEQSDLDLIGGASPVRQLSETLESKTGEKFKMNIDKYPIPATPGQPPRILVVGTNVTEIERAQEALARQEAQFRSLFEGSPLGMILIDSHAQVCLANSRIGTLFHIDSELLQDLTLNDLVPLDLHSAILPREQGMQFDASHELSLEFEMDRRDGVTIRIHLAVATILVGEEWMTLATFSDITQRHRDSMTLRKKQAELQRSNEDLDRFAYIASHDLKAPLRGIMHLSEWIHDDMPDVVSDDVRQHLKMLRTQVARMELLLNDLLSYARVSRQSGVLETIDLNETIPELFAFMSPPESTRLIIDSELPSLRAARGPLEQVFRNLIGNALKHAAEGEFIQVSAAVDGSHYQFTVRDDGPGIALDAHERIFGMFQTLQASQSQSGTGMGLHLVQRLVQLQGGKVWVESKPGNGAAFHFTWPQTQTAPVKTNA